MVFGMLAAFVFMFIYYKLFGLIADVVLVANVVLLTAFLSLVGAALTLPGIAAVVLTVGMAVDANILIYERIREELRNGVSPRAAITAGFDRAFSAIWDSNITALIAPAEVPEMPSMIRRSSLRNCCSTPQVKAPCAPPPCRARLMRLVVDAGFCSAARPGNNALRILIMRSSQRARPAAVRIDLVIQRSSRRRSTGSRR